MDREGAQDGVDKAWRGGRKQRITSSHVCRDMLVAYVIHVYIQEHVMFMSMSMMLIMMLMYTSSPCAW